MARLSPDDLVARAEISDTLHAYSRGIDRRDIDLLADLFTEDGAFDYGHGNLTRGREALRELFVAATGKYDATSHHCSTTSFLSLAEGRASTITYVYAFHDNREQDLNLHVWGCYEDELVDEGDRWRIATRRVRIAGVSSNGSEELPERFERYARG
ncbi:nuclear transport factor 2 family protein [Nocardioides hwasunensis]|uniref:Nuclear transport factor 2 family protein n=1 Tax=Nocardioides hwasunensis TaxID=397258 RepID=A0ABR8MNC7_9ACTN|nr:nuclear transport factor 2 family protein [Nocardioides hwasunensis]MBD3915604.1 nuclear transport factor 2 family protein [Nocardioides hwasunensis]